ncbi:MAG: bifunctional diaminohydroxyphosphoribosylaminopyrimidine deaminase/5-amino-6-(5-phosphoribosylamino)uracil reductase RibD [Thermodesulfovibrio sp.]|nr:bifunctional diaminohydroxyphosphoribosylaminopyrimidine deaminase/5-amino-6-(5-phosphoribosylamino)uracil reductase RibD [Thermodesulfovibrio sp.]
MMTDEYLIKRTLSLAARAYGRTSPNPMVGAVVVKGSRIIAEGYHKKAGTPHAEAIALEKAGGKARGATLYVSLEPCCHRDKRTPPCTEKIIASGIGKVVIAMQDPNPKVGGKGIAELRRAGIEVVSGILETRARALNEYYIRHVTTGRPFVILKAAMTLDGKIATPKGESKWITGEKARREVHRLRGGVDAILSAIGTVKADDPSLTCRTGRYKSPLRIILDSELEISTRARVLTVPPETMIVTKKNTHENKKKILREKGITILEHEGARADLTLLMQELGGRGITSVLIEGGSSLNASAFESGIVDKVMFFIAPKIIGGRDSFPVVGGSSYRSLARAYRIAGMQIKRFEEDILITGYAERHP